MKQKIPDQAEKLRQLAEQHKGETTADQAAATLDKPDLTEEQNKPALEESAEKENSSEKTSKSKKGSGITIDKKKKSEKAQDKERRIVAPEENKAEAKGLEKEEKPEEKKITELPNETVNDLLSSKRISLDGNTQVIAITGGKGGVGKTNVACNLGIAFAQMKKRVLLLDADLSLANADILLGLTPRSNLSHVISGSKKLEDIILDGPEGLKIVPGGSGLEELCNLTQVEIERIFESFALYTPAPDVLLIDTAAGIHPNVIQFLLAANQTIVVTTPEPPAYTDAYALIKTLARHDPSKEIGMLVNMAKDWREANEVTKLLLQICSQMLHVSFNNIGFIPRDTHVIKAVQHQQPFLLQAPNSPAAKALRNIAGTVLQVGSGQKTNRGLRGFFRRLFSQTQPTKEAAMQ